MSTGPTSTPTTFSSPDAAGFGAPLRVVCACVPLGVTEQKTPRRSSSSLRADFPELARALRSIADADGAERHHGACRDAPRRQRLAEKQPADQRREDDAGL